MAATDRAYEFAKPRILDGRFPGGELISEGNVAAATGLSRTPVREAFARLASEGLLQIYPKRGALVVPVSATEVESVMETRLLVEQFAIAKVISLNIELGSAPYDAIARQEDFAAAQDSRRFIEADHEFHRVFVAAAANPFLVQLHDSMRDRQYRMGLEALHRDESRTPEALGEHRMLLEAVAALDADRARAIVDKHIGTTLALLRGRCSTLS
jgi:DNA-binding GntR family transcriptional regulator